jgi:hypothetical protein
VVRITPVQSRILTAIANAPGKELGADRISRITQEALLRKGLVEACPRLYFGPRSLRYRLTEEGKKLVPK